MQINKIHKDSLPTINRLRKCSECGKKDCEYYFPLELPIKETGEWKDTGRTLEETDIPVVRWTGEYRDAKAWICEECLNKEDSEQET